MKEEDIRETTCSGALNPPANVAIVAGRGSVGNLKWGKKMLNNNKLIKGRKKPKNSFSYWGGKEFDPFKESCRVKRIIESTLDVVDITDNPFVIGLTVCFDNAIVFEGSDNFTYHLKQSGADIEIVRAPNSEDYNGDYEIGYVPAVQDDLIQSYNIAISSLANGEVSFTSESDY